MTDKNNKNNKDNKDDKDKMLTRSKRKRENIEINKLEELYSSDEENLNIIIEEDVSKTKKHKKKKKVSFSDEASDVDEYGNIKGLIDYENNNKKKNKKKKFRRK